MVELTKALHLFSGHANLFPILFNFHGILWCARIFFLRMSDLSFIGFLYGTEYAGVEEQK